MIQNIMIDISSCSQVSPSTANAAQQALSNEINTSHRVPSASPSSTIAADTPVFTRGSRNRVMGADVPTSRIQQAPR